MRKQQDLTQGSVFWSILTLGWPMIPALSAALSQALIDTIFVGQLGTDPLAALSFTFAVVLLFTSFTRGLSSGTLSVLSRAIGAKQNDRLSVLIVSAVGLTFILISFFCWVGIATIRPLFSALGAQGNVLDLIERYMQIYYIALPFYAMATIGHSVMRAFGDSMRPSIIITISSAINIILTPAMMLGWWGLPAWHIEGVAVATVIAGVVSAFVTLYYISFATHVRSALKQVSLKQLYATTRYILGVALPSASGKITKPIGIAIVTALIAHFGTETVAAFGVATRIEAFASLPMFAIAGAVGPIIGQSWGANKKHRVIQALECSYLMCVATSLISVLCFWFFGEALMRLFTDDLIVQREGLFYLYAMSVTLWGYGCVVVTAVAFDSLGQAHKGLVLNIIRTFAFYIPFAWAASLFYSSQEVFISMAICNGLAGIIAIIYSLWWLKKNIV